MSSRGAKRRGIYCEGPRGLVGHKRAHGRSLASLGMTEEAAALAYRTPSRARTAGSWMEVLQRHAHLIQHGVGARDAGLRLSPTERIEDLHDWPYPERARRRNVVTHSNQYRRPGDVDARRRGRNQRRRNGGV